ncbi:cystathionine gamma-lyase [Aphelenchoides avenae]|nr:cystathionine gamma-lyase [Aphelenchus avenae]
MDDVEWAASSVTPMPVEVNDSKSNSLVEAVGNLQVSNEHKSSRKESGIDMEEMAAHVFDIDDPEPTVVHERKFASTAIHAGNPMFHCLSEIVPPICLSTTYKWKPLIPNPEVYHSLETGELHVYSRYGNSTRTTLEQNVAALENGLYCRVFSSGMSACVAMLNFLYHGEHVLFANNIYGGVQSYVNTVAAPRHGIEVTFADFTVLENVRNALKSNTRMVWFETPSNPLLQIVDIAAVARLVKEFNDEIVVVVDNTLMSPYFQKPLQLGADAVVHSITKYINGHTDVLMGAVVTNKPRIDKHCFQMQYSTGAIPSPFDCYLAHRGLKTLHLRMQCHMTNALAIATWLEKDSRVETVLHPELPSHPQRELHKKQASGMCGVVSFKLKGGLEEAHEFLLALKVFVCGTSLGGYESLAEVPYTMMPAISDDGQRPPGITPNLIRLSVGCENKDDLIADLDHALKKAVGLGRD